jgi:chorismate-pyruvate lyase
MPSLNASTVIRDVDAARDPQTWFALWSGAYFGAAIVIEPWQVPEPYRTLLVHEGSMTERLERYRGGSMTLDVLSVSADADRYARWILLHDPDGLCCELGGASLDLRHFREPLRTEILDGVEPLGRLLSRHGIAYTSVPRSFLCLTPTKRMQQLLQMTESRRVFGRRTELRAGGQTLGDVLEVLPCHDVQIVPRRS